MWHVLVNGDMGSFGGRPGVMRLATLSSRLTQLEAVRAMGINILSFASIVGI